MTEPRVESGGGRLVSLDAYRGFVMLAMASAGLALADVAARRPGNVVWQMIASQVEHSEWRGCTAWDLIQPSFMFIVGVAMPFSYAARAARGDGFGRQMAHALWRSAALVLLGLFLSSAWSEQTNFSFAIVLCQIGLGYPLVFLLLRCRPWAQVLAALMILVGYWFWFAHYPLPGTGRHGFVRPSIGSHGLGGEFLLHWAKGTNAAAAFDCWFLNQFPRPGGKPFLFNEGGYATLNFVPSIATMLFGVVAGDFLRWEVSGRSKVQALIIGAALGIVSGLVLDVTVCPIVKRIWTPSWVIYSAGWTCLLLAFFYGVIEVAGWRRWAFPLVVVGLNSIAFYVMAQLMRSWVADQLRIHLTAALQGARNVQHRCLPGATGWRLPDRPFAGEYGPVVQSAAVLLVFWLIALWMYRRKIFIRL
jgi:heparan-alpha-glucosaminide N-acetyltransferase